MPPDAPGTLVAPQPVPPERQYSFTDQQVNNPGGQPPGDKLDGEYDRTNQTISDTIAWTATSLNTDGSLKPHVVGESQLVPGLLDDIGVEAVALLQPMVEQTGNYATEALNAVLASNAGAALSGRHATQAGNFADEARKIADTLQTAARDAEDDARSTSSDADRAENAANHADGSEAVAQAYADVGMAWAEHMPDTIPPNILAVQNITGDHWSARWWANQALKNVSMHTPLDGGTLTGPLYWIATGSTALRSAQDRSAEVLYAEDYGVVPNAADNTAALQAFFAALQAYPGAVLGILPSGWINFKTPINALNGKQHFALRGSGISATWLNYTGVDTTVDLLHIFQCSNFSMSGFVIDSATPMTAGTALHLDGCGSCWMNEIKIGGQSGAYHTGSDGNWHYNLWNGLWIDKTGIVSICNFELSGQNDASRINGVLGGGAGNKADCFFTLGKIMGARVGVHIGGAYGGFCIDNVDVIGNWYNCVIDQALTPEINREIFFSDHAIFDSSGGLGTPTYPGPANPGGGAIGDNIVVDDPDGGFLVIRGWAVTAFQNGNCIHIKNWAGVIRIDGCLIAYARADGIRIDTDVPQVIVTEGTNIHDVTGWGINKTVGTKPVLGAPTFTVPHTGDISSTTKLTLPAKLLSLAFQRNISAAGTTQATATPITGSYVTVAVVAAGSGVILPAVPDGTKIEVFNINGSNTPLTVYPPVGWSIFGTGTNTPLLLPPGFRGALIASNSDAQYMTDYIGPFNTNALVQFSPDVTSMQSGAYSFGTFDGTNRFSTAYGNLALRAHGNAGQYNTAFGGYAGFGVTGASSNNTLIGALSGYCVGGSSLGSNNTFLGALTAYSMTSGSNNTLIGVNAGNGLTTGSGNIFLGDGSGISFGSATESNTLRIGTNSVSVLRATAINTTAPKLFLDWLVGSTPYANDGAAAAGGVQIGQVYRTSASALMMRVT